MNQLTLDLSLPPTVPNFDMFIAERNKEVVNALTSLGEERFLYLWGQGGSGKTHLLKAWIDHYDRLGFPAIYLDASEESLPDFAREASFIAVDHVDELTPNDQIMLFSIYNSFKQSGKGYLSMAGRLPPMQMQVRDDLRTRLGWGLIMQVHALSDEEKVMALNAHAKAKQLAISTEVFRYLLTHWRRDLPSLIIMIEQLDSYSLALHKPITVSLVKQVLQQTNTG